MMTRERIATTFRIEPVIRECLSRLSRLEHSSLNELVNRAIREFVQKRMPEVEADLESTLEDLRASLEDLRAYRKRDPNFERAIAKFVEAEVTTKAKDDPAEGRVVSRVVGRLNR
jgi:hypothetical protein